MLEMVLIVERGLPLSALPERLCGVGNRMLIWLGGGAKAGEDLAQAKTSGHVRPVLKKHMQAKNIAACRTGSSDRVDERR